jgi:hypothetical protein
MLSPIEDAPENPSSKLPYELLSQIFIHCLPLHPLTEPQPNTKIAPMLLCHVCSSWRDVALTCTPIWSHLFFKLPILWDPREGHPIVWDSKALIGDIECLQWWRKNQGSIPPSIHFDFRQRTRGRLSDANHQDSDQSLGRRFRKFLARLHILRAVSRCPPILSVFDCPSASRPQWA